jgi:MinD superfamily P-loop ATPase
MDSDVIVLVTEPTPFGFYDFKLAWEAFSPLGKPMGVVVNRAGIGNGEVYRFCEEKVLPVLAEIPFDRAVAQAYSQGRIIADLSPELRQKFVSMHSGICRLAEGSLSKEGGNA